MRRWLARWLALWLAWFAVVAGHPVALAGPPAPPAADVDDALDRTTPRRAFEGFRKSAAAGDYAKAAQYLDLRGLGRGKAESDGPELARDLAYVLERRLPVDPATLADTPDAGDGKGTLTVASVYVGEEPIYVNLSRSRFADGVQRWQIAKSTVAQIPELDAAYGPRPWEEKLPDRLRAPHVLGNAPWQWAGLVAGVLIAWALGRVLARLALKLGRRLAKRTKISLDDALVDEVRPPLRSVLAIALFRVACKPLALTLAVDRFVGHVTGTALIVACAWLVVRVLSMIARLIERTALGGTGERDELRTRGLRTQLTILHRIASILVGFVALASVLLQFEVVRAVGTSLLASAGVAGIVLGLAAQKSLGAIIAGVQLSLAQPVRIGDTVVVDGQNGKVEELHLTYVVVKLGDERRLIVPIGKFLESSFENWTKQGTRLQGEVALHADYLAPVEAIREELERVVRESEQWDERVCKLEVVDATERGITLRATVSAAGADELWELRCVVRERLVRFLAGLDGGRHLVRARGQALS